MATGNSILFLAFLLSAAVLVPQVALGTEHKADDTKAAPEAEAEEEEKPYFFKDGKIDFGSYNGFRRFHSECFVCHGPDANGSSFAPALRVSLQTMSYDDFLEVVVNGRESNIGGVQKVMPAMGENPNVMLHIDDIYAYLKARADGVLKPGRPPRLPKGEER